MFKQEAEELLAQEELEKAELRTKHFRGAMEEEYGVTIPLPQTEPDDLVVTWLGNHQGKQPEPVTCHPSGPWSHAAHPNVAAQDTNPNPPKHWRPPPAEAFDAWIDKLIPGVETNIDAGQASSSDQLVQAIVKIESERDLPKVEVPVFEGAPIAWPRFVEHFQIKIYCRPGISDSRRMDLLQSHLKGEARLMVQGLGYSGRNCAQALQELKRAFGHRVKVARAYIEKVTAGPVIPSREPQALRKFYVSVRDCITTLQQLNYVSDLYSAEALTQAARRIPTDKASKWNSQVVRISKSREPTMFDLQTYLQDCVSEDFNPYTVRVDRSDYKRRAVHLSG